jgi:hypothetical protein
MTPPRPQGEAWLFDDFAEGTEFTDIALPLDDRLVGLWEQIYGPPKEAGVIPSGLLVATMMKAYLSVFQPRPPGNIHAGQKLAFRGRKVMVGSCLTATVACRRKQLRKERRWVDFAVTLHDGGDTVLVGEISSIWAR